MPAHDPLAVTVAPGRAAKSFDVFLSYSRSDQAAVGRIAAVLKRRGLSPWLDRWSLTPGGHWQEELAAGLADSRACAVFIGGGDLGAWEREEIELAVEHAADDRDFRVFAVLLPGVDPLDPGALPPFLRTRTWVDMRAGSQDPRGLDELVCAIEGSPFGPDVPVEPLRDEAPYRGLQVFEEQHAPFFFGRDGDVQRLLEQLKHSRFLAVLGASGSGKSSLVRAGLVPALRAGRIPGSDAWRIAVIRFGAHPLESLAAGINALDDPRALEPILDDLTRGERGLHLAAQAVLADRPPGEHAVLVVDQLEEAFTLCADAEERSMAFDNLAYAASRPGGRVVVVVTMRAEFYPRLVAQPRIARLAENVQELVGGLGRDGLRQAIEGPAHCVGLEVAPGLADAIIDDAGPDPGALPLLEHALLETWRLSRGGRLTHEAYAASGAVAGALAKRADDVYAELSADERDIVRRLLLRLTEPGEGVPDTRRRAPMAELLEAGPDAIAVERVIGRLSDERLLTTELDESGQSCVEVAHEALIRGWPRLQGWIDERRVALVVERRVTLAAAEWERLGRDDSALQRGAQLVEALDAHERGDLELTEREREFLMAGKRRQRREQGARRRRRAWAFVALALVLAASGAVVVLLLEQERRARLAEASRLATRSAGAVPGDPGEALSLALASLEQASTPEGEAALRQATHASRELLSLRADSAKAWSVSASPDGRHAVSGGADGVAGLWDLETARKVASLPDGHGAVYTARYSPSGRRIAVGYEDGTVIVTDASLGDARTVDLGEGSVSAVAFDGADATLAAAVDNGVRLITLDGSPRVRALEGGAAAYSVDIAADGTRVVGGGAVDGKIRVWSGRTGRLQDTLPASRDQVVARFSPDGTRILGAGDDVTTWDARTGERLGRWTGGGQPLDAAGVSQDDRSVVAAAGEDGIIRVWTWDGAAVDEWRAHRSDITDVSFIRGDRVISAGVDGTVRISRALSAEAWEEPGIQAVEFDPDQRLLAGGRGDGTVVVWNATTQAVVETLGGRDGYTDATFSPTGDTLLINRTADEAGARGSVRSWPVAGGPQRAMFSVPAGEYLNTVEFDRTGKRFVWTTDKRVLVHDLDSGENIELGAVRGDMRDARISPDGSQVAAAGVGGVVKLWRLDHPDAPYLELEGHENDINTIAWNQRGDRIVSAALDGTARVWNVDDASAIVLRGHEQPVTSALFTDAGTHVLTASDDGTVRLWDVRGDRAPVVLETRAEAINDATLAPDGRTIASTGADGTVRVYECEVCGSSASVLELARSRSR